MKHFRIYADAAGETHFEELSPTFAPHEYAPPAPPLDLSALVQATGVLFVRFPAGWVGDWHPTPRRQMFIFLSGTVMGETSDGAQRRVRRGDTVLLEDTSGKGHRAWTVDGEAVAAVVHLPERPAEMIAPALPISDTDDPMRQASYRSAVRVAMRQGISLAAERRGRSWSVTARTDMDGRTVTTSAPTPADAAWHAIAALTARVD